MLLSPLARAVLALVLSSSPAVAAGAFDAAAAADGCGRWDDQFTLRGVNGTARSVVVIGTDLYVAGIGIAQAGSTPVQNIARWDGTTWSSIGGTTGQIYTLATNGTDLFVGGSFSNIGGVAAENLARWNGSTWSRMWTTTNGSVEAIAPHGTELYVGGSFTSVNGTVSASRVARWNGSAWSPLGSGVTTSSSAVQAIGRFGGDLYAAGTFSTAGAVNARGVARWDGTNWNAVGSSMFGISTVRYGLATRPDGLGGEELLLAGSFDGIGDVATRGIARWDGAGWSPVDSGNGVNGFINWLGWGSGGSASGRIYAAGSFTTAGGVNANRIARYDVTTHTCSALGTGVNAAARAVAARGDTVYAGGDFTQAGGVNATRIARWNGSAWSAMGAGMNNRVEIISIAPDGAVYAGGTFTTAGGFTASRIACWNGTTWSALGSGVNSVVEEILFGDNGAGGYDVYVAGQFTTAGGQPANRVAKWNGSAWSTFGTGVDAIVDALWIDPRAGGGYDVYVGGTFLNAGGAPASRIAKWDGAAWSELGGGMNGSVNALTMHQGVLYAGGGFTTAGADSAYGVAAWNGATWSRLGRGVVGSGADAIVVSDTSVYLGGLFTNVGCVSSANFARYSLVDPLLAVGDPPRRAPLALAQNAPNPFRNGTAIAFQLPDARHVSLRVHDVAGRVVATLAHGLLAPGRHEFRFAPTSLAHGVYFYTLRAGDIVESRKMLFVR